MECYECIHFGSYSATRWEPGECWCSLDMEEFFENRSCDEFEDAETVRDRMRELTYGGER